MTRGGIRPVAAFAAALLVAALLAACGGSSDSDSTSSTEAAPGLAREAADGQQASNGDSGGDGQSSSSSKGGDSGASKHEKKADVATPLKVSGGGSEQFEVKGGDNSVQEYGDEKGETELREAAEATHDFLVARAEGRWADACSYISKSLLDRLEQLAEKSERSSCASFLASFTTRLPPAAWRAVTTVDAGSLRQEGEQAFLIYYGAPGKTVYSMPMNVEGGEWKVGALASSALPGAS